MQRDRFETSKLEKTIDISKEGSPVVLLHITDPPELVGDDLRQNRLAKRRDFRNGYGQPCQRCVSPGLGVSCSRS